MNHEFSIASIDYYKQEMCGYVLTEIIFLTKHIFCYTKCMDNYIDAIKNHYFDFSGRATRTQFWMFVLVNILVSMGIGILMSVVGKSVGSMLSNLYSLFVLAPSLAIAVRRLHDIKKSGWWLLLAFVPIIGWIILIILYAMPTEK